MRYSDQTPTPRVRALGVGEPFFLFCADRRNSSIYHFLAITNKQERKNTMKKFIKMILVAAIAMGGMTMEAKELTDAQKVEVKAIALVAELDGYRSYGYNCSAGVQTNGYGCTKAVLTKSMDRKTADRILGREIRKIQKEIKTLVTRKLTVDQEVALISFVYNLGLPKFKSSTLLKRINDGSSNAIVSAEFNRWVYGGLYKKDKNGQFVLDANEKKIPVPLKGLVKRRAAEVSYWCA